MLINFTQSYSDLPTTFCSPSATSQSGPNSSVGGSSGAATDPQTTASSSSSSANQSWPKNDFAANAIAQAHAAAKMGNTTDPVAPQMPGAVGQYSGQVHDVQVERNMHQTTYEIHGHGCSSKLHQE